MIESRSMRRAGFHADYLCRELMRLGRNPHLLHVLCFADQQTSGGNYDMAEIAGMPELLCRSGIHETLIDVLRAISP